MAKSATTHTIPAFSPDELFKRLVDGLPGVGIEIWKSRSIGWLIMAKRTLEAGSIDVTIQIRPGPETLMTISQSSTVDDEAALQMLENTILGLISSD